MNAAAERLEFAPPATPGLLRALLLALLAHGLLLAALTWGVQWKRDAPQPSFDAELWAAVPQEAAPPAPPPMPIKPLPTPPKTPTPPVQATPSVPVEPAPQPVAEPPRVDIALEREKQRQREQERLAQARELEKIKQEKLLREKLLMEKQQQEQRQAKRLAAEKAQAEKRQAEKRKQAQEKKKAEQDAKRLEAQRQQNLQRMAGMADATGSASASGTALRSVGPSASYAGRIRARVKPNIVFTQDIAGNPTAEVEVRTAPDGTIVARKITRSSGVKEWDDAVLKALDKTEILPRDIDGSMPSALLLVFRPKD